MTALRGAAAVVLAAIPVHVWVASTTDLTPDEAYYLASARDGPIPDHPPLVPWMIAACDRLGWLSIELRVRLPAIVLSALVALAIAHLTHQIDRRPGAAVLAAVFATWLPIPMAGGFVTTPDAAALLGVTAALGWAASPDPAPGRTAATACLVALGALAKVVVVPIAILAAALGAGTWRRRATWLVPLALVCPLLVASVRFQTHHAFGAGRAWSVGAVLLSAGATLAAALALWCPPLVVLGLARIGALHAVYRATFVLVAALLVGSTVARAEPPEPNWWAPAAVPLIVAGSAAIAARRLAVRRACVALAVVPTIAALTHVVWPWIPIPRRLDPTARLHGWRTTDPPLDAPGIGPYAAASERCVYQSECDDIASYIAALNHNRSSGPRHSPNR